MGLFFLTPGRLRAPEILLHPVGARLLRRVLIPTTVAVLTDADGRAVLVDAGFSRREIEDPRRSLGLAYGLTFPLVGTTADSAASQLEARGISPAAVDTIVATHLHLDHVGAFVDFPNAEIVAPAAEFASARDRGQLGGYVHIHPILRSGRARPVLYEAGGSHGFLRHKDLLGDGRVLLLDARGHTAGSTAVLLRDPETGRSALMAGDAAYTAAEYRLARMCRLMKLAGLREDWIRATWGALLDFETQHPTIPVVPSHDPDVYAGLPHR